MGRPRHVDSVKLVSARARAATQPVCSLAQSSALLHLRLRAEGRENDALSCTVMARPCSTGPPIPVRMFATASAGSSASMPNRVRIIWAVAVPDGKRNFSLRMVWVRRGTAMKTPKNARAAAQASSWPADSLTGPCGGFSSDVSLLRAGTTPTKPAARGIVAVATAVVCTITFSATVKSRRNPILCPALKSPKPSTADWTEPMVTHPVCRPKCMLLPHSKVPMSKPATTARTVNSFTSRSPQPAPQSRLEPLPSALPFRSVLCSAASSNRGASSSRGSTEFAKGLGRMLPISIDPGASVASAEGMHAGVLV
mmetsp:Transcript_7635/g.22605  ORF Transcript_7635/g.22605 Transcript_7635/m.22605 type:complete len:311 (+) Transcript_7635:1794-2726(+)